MSDKDDFGEHFQPAMPEGGINYEWAKNNPNDEYNLWLMTRGRNKLADEVERRYKMARYGPFIVKAQAVGAATLGLVGGYGVAESIADGRYGSALVFTAISLVPFSIARSKIKNELPDMVEWADRERMYYDEAQTVIAELNEKGA